MLLNGHPTITNEMNEISGLINCKGERRSSYLFRLSFYSARLSYGYMGHNHKRTAFKFTGAQYGPQI